MRFVRAAGLCAGARASALILACALLAGCGPAGAPLASPVGTWRAVADDTGTLTFDDDGTFAFAGASFNPISSHGDAAGYNGVGRWELSGANADVYLIFSNTPRDPTSTGTQLSTAFASGRIVFHDAERTVGIEFELDD